MNKIAESIICRQDQNVTAVFPVWARAEPKDGLAQYPKAIKSLGLHSVTLIALVDDILPSIIFERNPEEQAKITGSFRKILPSMGFDDVCILSDTGYEPTISEMLSYSQSYTVNEFARVLPERKTLADGDYQLSEVVEFTWQIGVLRFAMESLGCTAFIAGMHTKFFYLAAKKVLPKVDLYFLDMK